MSRRISNSLVLGILLFGAAVQAKEIDQFSDRWSVLRYYAGGYRSIPNAPGPKQVDAVLDAQMNVLLDRLLDRLRASQPRSIDGRDELVRRTFMHPLLPELVTPYEEWATAEARIPLYWVRDKGIYGHAVDFDDMRMAWYIELSPTIQVSGVLIGLDKLGHFIGQGFDYYRRYRHLDPRTPVSTRLAEVRFRGHLQEFGQLGIATGGVYSFADLAANWSGMTFFMALFEDVDVEGDVHARYFARTPDGRYRRVRDFHWSEYATSDWDEVLNPTGAETRALYDKVVRNLWRAQRSGEESICRRYRDDPAGYLGPSRALRPRERYSAVEAGEQVAPYALDVRVICRTHLD